MTNLPHDLLLMATNLAQIKNRPRVITLFIEEINTLFPNLGLGWADDVAPGDQNQVEVCTRNGKFGFIVYSNEIYVDEETLALIHNASQMLGVVLENLHQEQLLLEQKQALETLAEERAQMAEELELRVAQRTADLERANQSLHNSRLAALNMMEDAIEARQHAEEIAASLQREIAERKRTEAALRESEERLRLAHKATNDVVWDWDVINDTQKWNEAGTAAFGWTESVENSVDAYWWVDRIHPEDRQRVEGGFFGVVEDTEADYWHDEYRFQKADGSYAEVMDRGYVLRDAQGRAMRMIGAMLDITERKRAEEAEREQRVLAEALRDTATVLNSILDFETILDHVLAYVGRVVPHDAANIMLIEGDTAYVVRSRGYEKYGIEDWARSVRVLVGTRPKLIRALQSQQGYIVFDTQADDEWIHYPETSWIRSHVAQVIRTGGHVIGLINLDSTLANTFSSADAERLQAFADQVAVAIQNAQMYQKLASYSADLEQAVIERTAELIKSNEDLEAANEQLRLLSRAKDDFVSNVSHELRTPLTSLTLRYHIMEKHPEQFETHLGVIERETARLTQIINDLLSLSRLDQRRVALVPDTVNLNELIDHYVTDRTLLFSDKGLTLEFEPEAHLSAIVADQGLLGQVLSILLTNASNYTPSGGRIMVRTLIREESNQRWVGFSVSDTGPGISAEEQRKLFTRFFRGTVGRQSRTPGTGLGLAIAKEIVDMHEGSIGVSSTGIAGEGATFTVWLPQ